MKNTLQSNWPILFKHVKVVKDEESLRNHSRLKETQETWKLNAVRSTQLDPESLKDVTGTEDEIWKGYVT